MMLTGTAFLAAGWFGLYRRRGGAALDPACPHRRSGKKGQPFGTKARENLASEVFGATSFGSEVIGGNTAGK